MIRLLFFLFLTSFAQTNLTLDDATYLCTLTTSLTGWTTGWNCNGNPGSVVSTACQWTGVTCTVMGENSYVSSIALGGTPVLNGTLPSGVFKLMNLVKFSMTNQKLAGTIPGGFEDANFLESLVLNLGLSGSIPPSIGSITTLSSLDLSGNALNGTLPATLGLPTYLESINIQNNPISGTLPAELGPLLLTNFQAKGTLISGGCYPKNLRTDQLLQSCDLSSSSFYCDCDAPSICKAKQCCANVAGLLDQGFVCENGGWKSPGGPISDLTVNQPVVGLKTVIINGDLIISGSLQIKSGSLEVVGALSFNGSNPILLMQANTSISATSMDVNGTNFRIEANGQDLENYLWTPITTTGSLTGKFKSVEFVDTSCWNSSLNYATNLMTVNFTAQACPTTLTTEQILALIFVPLCILGVIAFFVLIYTKPSILYPEQDERVQMLPDSHSRPAGNDFA